MFLKDSLWREYNEQKKTGLQYQQLLFYYSH